MPPAHAQTEEQRRRLAHVLDREERRRREVAHELQEDAAQALAGVLLGLGAIGSDRAAAEDPQRLAQVRSDLEATVVALRRLATALRPAALDQLGLRPALERLADEHAFTLDVEIDGRLPADLETVIYRVVEDAVELLDEIASVAVHADATGIAMRIAGHHRGEPTRFAGIGGRLDTVDGDLEIEAGEPGPIVLRATIPARG
jgi:two-component system, NarL family, sensor histidine kinase UhpB